MVKLLIPADAKRSNAAGRKCRAEFAKVLDVIGADIGLNGNGARTEYRKGEIVRPDSWDDDWKNECSGFSSSGLCLSHDIPILKNGWYSLYLNRCGLCITEGPYA